jgi:hypothetical protein
LASSDGRAFEPLAEIAEPRVELGDPRLSAAPDGRLILLCEASDPARPGAPRTLLSTSNDGAQWTPLRPPSGMPEGARLAGLAWCEGLAYTLAEIPGAATGERRVALFSSRDGGAEFEHSSLDLDPRIAGRIQDIAGVPHGAWGLLADAERSDRSLLMGVAYETGFRREVPYGVTGAALLVRPDGALLVGTRDGERGTARVLHIAGDGACSVALELPGSAGPGRVALAEHDGELWIAYSADGPDGAGLYVARADLAGL